MTENIFASASQDGIAAIWQLREEVDGTLGSICHLKVRLSTGDAGMCRLQPISESEQLSGLRCGKLPHKQLR